MKSTLTVKYLNGHEDRFEFELLDIADPEQNVARLRQLMEQPYLVLRVHDKALAAEDELRIIPMNNLESLSVTLPLTQAHTPGVVYVSKL